MKRIVFATLLAFVAVILVACSSFTRSDNGVYVFEPSTEDIKSILKRTRKFHRRSRTIH